MGARRRPDDQLVIDEELRRAGVARPDNPIGIGWAGPTILAGGTPRAAAAVAARPARRLEESGASCSASPRPARDLASLRTRAERDGDEYIVNGQKIWTTWANRSDCGILLARTDPDAPASTGASRTSCCDMRHARASRCGPIIEMTGGNHFNEVFLTDVRIPADLRIGPENGGWALAKVTLGNERVSLSEGGVLWGMGPTARDFFDHVRERRRRRRPARCASGSPRSTPRASLIRLLGDGSGRARRAAGDPGRRRR